MKKTEVLRELLRTSRPLVVPGAFNAMVARILEKVGFPVVYMSGYATSANLLGMPDAGLITMTEMVLNAKYMASAISVPLFADADTGFGNAINVRRTVQEFILAGVAGIHLEDQTFPKRCGHVAGKQVIPIEEAAGKIRAASDARNELDPAFVLIARTDARGAVGGGVDEAIRRGQAYAKAGADVVFVEGLLSEDEIHACVQQIKAPILYNYAGISPRPSLERLKELGVAAVVIPGATMRVTAEAVWNLAENIKNDLSFEATWQSDFEKDHPLGNFNDFVGFGDVRRLEERYLPADDVKKYQGTLGFKV